MKLICFIFISAIGLISYAASKESSFSYMLDLSKAEFGSVLGFEYTNIKLIVMRGSQSAPATKQSVTISYIGRDNKELVSHATSFSTRGCSQVAIGQPCASFLPSLHLQFYAYTCKIEFRLEESTIEAPWGKCAGLGGDVPRPFLSSNFATDEDESALLTVNNSGVISSRKFEVLLLFEDIDGQVISYEFRDIPALEPGESLALSIVPGYLYSYACRLKVVLDPRGASGAIPSVEGFTSYKYGECSGEEFEPWVDLTISSPGLIKSFGNEFILSAKVTNLGDVPVRGRALRVVAEGIDAFGNTPFRERSDALNVLGPKESGIVQIIIPDFLLRGVRSVSFDVNGTGSIFEFNKNNNKTYLQISE